MYTAVSSSSWQPFTCISELDPVYVSNSSIKITIIYSPWFSARNGKFRFRQNSISSERAPQEEQNGAYFSFVAPSSEEL